MLTRILSLSTCLFCASLCSGQAITIRNRVWNRVNVEVRKGKSDNPDQNASQGTQVLQKNGAWSVPCKADEGYVWWRRDPDPDHPNGSWADWNKKACWGRSEDVSL